jgi:GNAT acetyltransferase
MVPLGKKATDWLRAWDEIPHRSMALSHACLHDRPGLWVDVVDDPTSIVWLREGDEGRWEAFTSGDPRPAVPWLAGRAEGRTIALLASPDWDASVRSMGGRVESGIIETWHGLKGWNRPSPHVKGRRIALDDEAAFSAVAPSWALRSWGDFPSLIEHGVAFGVRARGGFASLAWTYESDRDHDKIGVITLRDYRRLGLGRLVATALLDSIVFERRKAPFWVTTATNAASIALARSLGFSIAIHETLLHWTPNRA